MLANQLHLLVSMQQQQVLATCYFYFGFHFYYSSNFLFILLWQRHHSIAAKVLITSNLIITLMNLKLLLTYPPSNENKNRRADVLTYMNREWCTIRSRHCRDKKCHRTLIPSIEFEMWEGNSGLLVSYLQCIFMRGFCEKNAFLTLFFPKIANFYKPRPERGF